MRLRVLLFGLLVFTPALIFSPLKVLAVSPYDAVCDDPGAQSSAVCQDSAATDPSPIYGPNGILPKVANLLAIIGGVIAVVIIMISGLKMIMSSGDSKKLSDARNAIIYAAVGLVVIALARVIIEFILRLVS
jgi:hypothetical protein